MPTLEWIGKDKVVNHHQEVPYRVLDRKYSFDENGQSDTDNGSENKIIRGDNLEALKALLPQYEGMVKCIYIDPPYNTGNEGWVYNDNVNHPKIKKWLGEVVGKEGEDLSRHDKWLCMMYPRLKLLHKLLADDGAIFISIDDNEQANLKLICDEIFGANNFVCNVVWEKKSSPQNDAKWFSDSHDFIVIYAKRKNGFSINKLNRTEIQNSIYKNSDEFDGIDVSGNYYGRGPWFAGDMTVKTVNENALYPIITPAGNVVYPASGRAWVYFEDKFKELLLDHRITFGNSGKNKPCIKRFLTEIESNGIVPKTNWHFKEVGENRNARQELKKIFSEIQFPFETPKPPLLLERIIHIATNQNSIILDSFSGSGTTAHAVLNMNKADGGNRKFILVEMEDYAETITAERVKRVINGYADVMGTGGNFSFFELGEPLLIDNQYINENISKLKICEYVYFMETKMPLEKNISDNEYYLGKHNDTAYYFYYEKERITTLNHDFLATINTSSDGYIIYADKNALSNEEMLTLGIVFKKIPRDIARL